MTDDNWIAVGSAGVTALLTGLGLYLSPKLAVKHAIKQFQTQKKPDEYVVSVSRRSLAIS
jgi:hypothetical protein